MKAAQTSGVDVNVVYDATNNGTKIKKALAETGTASLVEKVRNKQVGQAHNKFFVLLDKDDGPFRVSTGSTNISEKGIFGHYNTGHQLNDPKIAARYFEYLKLVCQNLDRKAYQDAVLALPDGGEKKAAAIPNPTLGFSPWAGNVPPTNGNAEHRLGAWLELNPGWPRRCSALRSG